jgi:hypothetical protein
VTVLFILYLLFDIKPEQRAKSKVGLSVLPLPTHKHLWEAATEGEWIEKYDEMLRARDGRCYLRYADLMALGRGHGGDKIIPYLPKPSLMRSFPLLLLVVLQGRSSGRSRGGNQKWHRFPNRV